MYTQYTSLQTLYTETIAQEIMLAAIQAQTHVYPTKKTNPNHMLLSYSSSYKNNILQCAAYGFWTNNKKNAIIVNITEDEETYIQNPKETKDIGRSLQAYIQDSPYRIAQNSRIDAKIQRQLSFIGLVTNIDKISILHIGQNQVFTQEIQDYIQTLTQEDTIIISLANIQKNQEPQDKKDALAYALRTKLQENNDTETLKYKPNNTIRIQNNKDYIHQAI